MESRTLASLGRGEIRSGRVELLIDGRFADGAAERLTSGGEQHDAAQCGERLAAQSRGLLRLVPELGLNSSHARAYST